MKNRNLKHSDNWETPKWLYGELDKEFNFDFDPCPLNSDIDGLAIGWKRRNFVNPPYSRKLKEAFIKKGFEEWQKGKVVVFLLPVSTSTKIFHSHIYPYAEIRFLKGRVAFKGINTKGEYVTDRKPMHDSMVCVFKHDKEKA